jgi:hypothetical protein
MISMIKLYAQPEACLNLSPSALTITVSNSTACDIVIITEKYIDCGDGNVSIGSGYTTTIKAGQQNVNIPYWMFTPTPESECSCTVTTYVTIYFASDPGQTHSYIWNPNVNTLWASAPYPMHFSNVCNNSNVTLYFIQDVSGTYKGILSNSP